MYSSVALSSEYTCRSHAVSPANAEIKLSLARRHFQYLKPRQSLPHNIRVGQSHYIIPLTTVRILRSL